MGIRLNPEVLDRARHIDGLTSDEKLGHAIGKTGATVSAWRKGATVPNVHALVLLKKITGIPLDHMLINDESVRASA